MYADAYQWKMAPNGRDEDTGYVDYTHVKRFCDELKRLEFKSKKKYNGLQVFGRRILDHRDHVASNAELQKLQDKFKR